GVNTAVLDSYTSELMFVDAMKMSRKWIASDADCRGCAWESGVKVPLDANGYPLQIPYSDGKKPPQLVKTLMLDGGGLHPAGDYTLMFDGKGEIQLEWDTGTKSFKTAGAYPVKISQPKQGVLLTIKSSKKEDPIRNIRFILPGFAGTYEEEPFYPPFLDLMRGAGTIRYGDLMQMNSQPCSNGVSGYDPSCVTLWKDRTTADTLQQTLKTGVALEYLAKLSNTLDANMWITLPTGADDDYVRQAALLLKSELNPHLKVYLEWSNEVWNFGFPQASFARDRAQQMGLTSDCYYNQSYYAHHTAEIFKIFNEAFGDPDRVINVLGSQAALANCAEAMLKYQSDPKMNPTGYKAEALAIGAYFGHDIGDKIAKEGLVDSITVDQILDRANKAVDDHVLKWTKDNKKVADKYGVILIAYEGGQHLVATGDNVNNKTLTDKLVAANRHPRMYALYQKMFDAWYNNGGKLFAAYNNVGGFSKWGSWGLVETLKAPPEKAPKYTAWQDRLETLGATLTPRCDDGIDNDGDTLIDYGEDSTCRSKNGNYESDLYQ
ncbi:MAG: hypothetical protein KDK65_01835, partial [Chlamydiia bacterium]|nr:hypothetical protein [Chlamydiia bacterium]